MGVRNPHCNGPLYGAYLDMSRLVPSQYAQRYSQGAVRGYAADAILNVASCYYFHFAFIEYATHLYFSSNMRNSLQLTLWVEVRYIIANSCFVCLAVRACKIK